MNDDLARTSAARPTLWNPNAAANWSLLFSPAFGAFLHARNWEVLGRPGRAAANWVWVGITVAFLAGALAMQFFPGNPTVTTGTRLAGIGILLGWYFTQGRTQARFVRTEFPTGYQKKTWRGPIAIGLAAVGIYVAASLTVAMTAGDWQSSGSQTKRPVGTVRGIVAYQGRAIPAGRIVFHPAEGAAVTAAIVEGRFTAEGVPVGTVKVTVEADGFKLPVRWSVKEETGLFMSVTEGDNSCNFELSS